MIKVGIIGAGRIGRVHITSITTRVPDAVIKTVADPFLNDETVHGLRVWVLSTRLRIIRRSSMILRFPQF